MTRFDDVMHVLKTPEQFSSRAMFTMIMAGGSEKLPPLGWNFLRFLWRMVSQARLNPLEFRTARNLIAEDGESHAAMRAIVNRGFTPRRITAWEPRIRELVEQCAAPLRRGEPFEVVRDLAVPVPVTIIAEMIGVPADRVADFKHSRASPASTSVRTSAWELRSRGSKPGWRSRPWCPRSRSSSWWRTA